MQSQREMMLNMEIVKEDPRTHHLQKMPSNCCSFAVHSREIGWSFLLPGQLCSPALGLWGSYTDREYFHYFLSISLQLRLTL